jgi:hypothetical protein
MQHSASRETNLEAAIVKLVAYCRANDWAGHDPYDALNSPVFRTLPFLDHRLPRLVLTQALKRSPVNFRRLLHIPKRQNPKALALFLSSFVILDRASAASEKDAIDLMIDRLCVLRSPVMDYWCWGYSFPWQTRMLVVPAGAPNLVCTSFVANALLDAAERDTDSRCFKMASSGAEYILNELYWTNGEAAGFSYPVPSIRTPVHNANLLAAALLCRVYARTQDEKFLLPALRVARCTARRQLGDGSWHYGESPSQNWIDNFHTGYNLCALQALSRYASTTEFAEVLRRGFEFYRSEFFREDGSVAYFHDRGYPIDIHCIAQSILTLLTLEELDPSNLALAHSVLRWALNHLWDDRGYFYYRALRLGTNRIPYMRWSQAWMLLAMVTLLDRCRRGHRDELDSQLERVGHSTHG